MIINTINKNTSPNKRYTLRRLSAARGSVLLGQSLRSFPRKTSPTFGRARLARPNVVYLERYMPFTLKLIYDIID